MPITPRLWGERGRRRAEKLGIDPDRLPPGQSPIDRARPRPEGTHAMVHPHGGHTTDLALGVLRADELLVAHGADGDRWREERRG